LGVVILDAFIDCVCCSFSADIFLDWIRNLPELLLQNEVSYHILMAFSCLGKQSNKVFLKSLESKATDVVGEFDFTHNYIFGDELVFFSILPTKNCTFGLLTSVKTKMVIRILSTLSHFFCII
jgi:hypothetical protein